MPNVMLRCLSVDALANTLRERRVSLDLTLETVAERTGVSASHLGRIERGERRPSASVLHKLSRVLQIPDTELLQLAGYLSAGEHAGYCAPEGRLDPFVARLLAKEPVETQRLVVAMLMVMKVVAREILVEC